MRVTASKWIEFDAGHRVPGHAGKCRSPHGHRYRVTAVIEGAVVETPGASDEGMVLDFGFVKEVLTTYVHDVLDHGFIVYAQDHNLRIALLGLYDEAVENDLWKVVEIPYVPTAENIARWVWEQVEIPVKGASDGRAKLVRIEVRETPSSLAVYSA